MSLKFKSKALNFNIHIHGFDLQAAQIRKMSHRGVRFGVFGKDDVKAAIKRQEKILPARSDSI